MKSQKSICVFVLVLLFILSCASTGKNFDLKKIDEIEQNVSTKNNILNLFGLPMSTKTIIENNAKFEIWSYRYTDAIGLSKSLSVKFDNDGTVVDYGPTVR